MKSVLIGGGVIIAIILVWSLSRGDNTDNITNFETNDNQPNITADIETTSTEEVTPVDSNPQENEEMRTSEQNSVSGSYQTYSADALAASSAAHNVLIFSATWCPSCRALDNDINENISNLPGDVALFSVDYDTSVALRQQYSVTTQHTLVLVEPNGTEIKKWVGGNTLSALLANI